jgi:hypothetical protein
MFRKTTVIRIIAIPVCMVSGLLEFFALQRVRLMSWRAHP